MNDNNNRTIIIIAVPQSTHHVQRTLCSLHPKPGGGITRLPGTFLQLSANSEYEILKCMGRTSPLEARSPKAYSTLRVRRAAKKQ